MPYHSSCFIIHPCSLAFSFSSGGFFQRNFSWWFIRKNKVLCYLSWDSPHIHSFLWFLNAPVQSKDKIDHYKEWVDNIISARLPDPTNNPKLFEHVKMYQLHRHSKTCRKYKNRLCRFNFGRYYTKKTINAKTLRSSLKDHKMQI